jgi:hypothetical protein
MIFVFIGTAMTPVFNIIGVPLVFIGSSIIHIVFMIWLLINVFSTIEGFENPMQKINDEFNKWVG